MEELQGMRHGFHLSSRVTLQSCFGRAPSNSSHVTMKRFCQATAIPVQYMGGNKRWHIQGKSRLLNVGSKHEGKHKVYRLCRFKMVPALGVIQRVLYETSQQLEEFYPESMLDFGSGPGTCVAACADKWPRLSEAITIEPSRSMADICSRLLERGPGSSLRVRRALSLPEYVGHVAKEDLPKFDVVTASYTFSELPSESARLVALSMLWEMVAHEGVLVLVESATSHGIDVVAQARRALVEDGLRYDTVFGSSQEVEDAADAVRVIAPCTHSLPCPMLHKKYPEGRFKTGCHFLQRTERLLTNPSSKGSGVGRRAQTERYSYLVLQKIANGVSAGSSSGRILRRPLLAKRQVILDLCQGDGRLERKTATKANSGSEVYRRARKASWGNVWST